MSMIATMQYSVGRAMRPKYRFKTWYVVWGEITRLLLTPFPDSQQLQCCGYFNATDEVAFGGNFCPDQATAIVANSFCVTPIVRYADSVLNNIFR